jgi:hypothetical protein
MFSPFEYTLSKHEETVRRAEANAALIEAARSSQPTDQQPEAAPRARLLGLLRRIAGSPAFA